MAIAAKKIEHPYITSSKAIRNNEPIIAGTGIRVLDVAIRYEIMSMSPEEIIVALPNLNLAQVHDALSYYYDNKTVIDKSWKSAMKDVETFRTKHPSILEKKIGKIKNIHR